ncbi:hypothetical protein [Methyloceanibacter sp. wino2]|uniref:hypothetical protein n=1 Tax=Methyloceanibacter sp. wino2 TaxID=2170729 RepID=UPI000D3ED3F9|nr:hypothetical protein [Methyloceanibacter sp. wino2]
MARGLFGAILSAAIGFMGIGGAAAQSTGTEPLRLSGAPDDVGQSLSTGALASWFGGDCAGTILLRRSKDAIGSIISPTCFEDAQGAQFAWADDAISNSEVWSAQGIVAARLMHRGQTQRYSPYVQNLAFAPYAYFDRVASGGSVVDGIDNLAYGAVFELSVANVLGATHYFDIDAEVVSSFAGDAKNWSIGAEWQPIGYLRHGKTFLRYFGQPLGLGRNFLWTITPKVYGEYVSEISDAAEQPIFADRDEALRVGPTVTLNLYGIKEFDDVPWWAQRFSLEVTYGWLYDTLSELDYELLDSSVTMALDEKGHLGLTLSYRKGQLIETGQDVDLAKLGLSLSY